MKILVLSGWYPAKYAPYSGDFVQEQVRGLVVSGIDAKVIYADLDYRYGVGGILRKRKYKVENGVSVFRLEGFGWPKKNKLLLDRWAKSFMTLYDDYVDKFGPPDLFHAHTFWGGYVAMLLSQKYGIPYVYTEHFSGLISPKGIPNWHQSIYLEIYNQATQVIAVSQALSNRIKDLFGVSCRVLPNFIDTELFYAKEQLVTVPKRFVTVGDLVVGKRFDLSIQAVNQLVNQGHAIELVIIGSGPEEQKLKRLVDKLDVKENVFFRGRLNYEAVAVELRKADVYMLTSDFETFGIVLVEAMSCGLPVIATDCLGPIDIVTSATGVVIPKDDVETLSKSMLQMISNYSMYSANEIHEYAESHFGFDVVIQKLKQLYQEVIDA